MSQGPVATAFGADHAALRNELADVVEALRLAAPIESLYLAFEARLRGHLRAEEQTLFPAFEAHTGLDHAGPTLTLRQSHRHIERRLGAVTQALSEHPEPSDLIAQLAQLSALLAIDNDQEESNVYPSCDRLLRSDEIAQALAALGTQRR